MLGEAEIPELPGSRRREARASREQEKKCPGDVFHDERQRDFPKSASRTLEKYISASVQGFPSTVALPSAAPPSPKSLSSFTSSFITSPGNTGRCIFARTDPNR